MEPHSPPGLLILGGRSTDGPLTSLESFGFDNCSIPPLPEIRYGFGSFITPVEPPQLSVCGGWWMGKPISTDCLTLNITSGQWERGSFKNGLLGDGVRGVISLEDLGVFLVHSTGVSFLQSGSDTWVAGPMFATSAECGCNVSSKSFVVIHMADTHNVLEYVVTDGETEPRPRDTWPSLLTKRYGPGCAATLSHLVIAGGLSSLDEVLTTVEVFHIRTKALKRGGSLQRARAFFQMIPVGTTFPRLLAIGGTNGTTALDTTEWWEEEEDTWQEGPRLASERANFAAVMSSSQLVCSETGLTDHSCPLAGNSSLTCTFPTMESGGKIILTSYRWQNMFR